jgi:hypothetical protein
MGIFILGMLQKEPDPEERFDLRREDCLVLRFYDRRMRDINKGKFLSTKAKDHVRRKWTKMFKRAICEYVRKQNLDTGIHEKYAMRNFLRQYNITEEDYAEESMYREYHRWKAENKVTV